MVQNYVYSNILATNSRVRMAASRINCAGCFVSIDRVLCYTSKRFILMFASKSFVVMKKLLLLLPLSALLVLNSCTNYQPEMYGPVEFETVLEGPRYAGSEMVIDALVELDFTPEDFNINRDEIYSMIMNEITLTTDYENGFGDFDNILFSFIADGVQSEKVATVKIEGSPKELVIPGLSESQIKKFKNVKKFHLEITAVTRPDIEESYDDIEIKGSMVMNIMVPEKK